MFSSLGVKAIIGAVLVAAVGGAWLYVRHLSSENAKLTANNAVLQGALDTERAVREELDRERVKADRLVADAIQRAGERSAKANVIKQEIVRVERVPVGCPEVPPAMSLALDRLRKPVDGSKAGDRPPEAAGQPAPVRPGTAGP